MGRDSHIQWCHHTFNGWIGCAKISPACKNCYAAVETFPRVQRAQGRELWGADAERHITSAANWRKPLAWDKAAAAAGERHRVFCSSLSDVFEDRPDLVEPRLRLWALIAQTPNLDWLLLTKRPENILLLAPHLEPEAWPNVWLGTTCEDQERADERIPHLLSTPAAVRFLSVEPQLEMVHLWAFLKTPLRDESLMALGSQSMPGVDWVIVGGESGPAARPFQLNWARSIVRQCEEAGVACFVKQMGSNPEPIRFEDPKGGAIEEWPLDLRVRQFPSVRA